MRIFKRRMPVSRNGFITCHDCHVARFLRASATCPRHRPRKKAK